MESQHAKVCGQTESVSLISIPQIKVASFIEAQFDWYELRVGYTPAALVEIKHHGEKESSQEEEDPWVQYDLLKQRLKRLRVRFYRQRADDKNRLSGSRHLWKDRQNEVLNDLNSYGMVCVIYKDHQTSITFVCRQKNAGGLKTKRG